MLKYGIKIWTINKPYFSEAAAFYKKGLINFVELYIVPDAFSEDIAKALKNVPLQIHAPHFFHHFDVSNLPEEKITFFKNQVQRAADLTAAQYIIVHAGQKEPPQVFKENIAKIYDPRILIENMPKVDLEEKPCFGSTLEELKFIKQKCSLNICLDLGHAINSAISQNIDYKDFIQSLLSKLKPWYFHISGGRQESGTDEHLNLFEGDFDIKWLKSILVKLAKEKTLYLVFEVPKKGEDLENDLRNIKYFKTL